MMASSSSSSSSSSTSSSPPVLLLLLLITVFPMLTSAHHAPTRKLALVQTPATLLNYHKGPLLNSRLFVNLIWYGKFTPSQRSIIADFVQSLSSSSSKSPSTPTVADWWNITSGYTSCTLSLGRQYIDDQYTHGKILKPRHILALSSKLLHRSSINIILTSPDVTPTPRYCSSTCATHATGLAGKHRRTRYVYGWVGNPATQCPGQCAWPFHQPMFGPQTPPLLPPNGDAGVDGMIINLATILAGAATNPYGTGYFQGDRTVPLEAVSACAGTFGSGAFPGDPGKVLLDQTSGASFNAYGVRGRKYLLPAMWDPKTKSCKTLV